MLGDSGVLSWDLVEYATGYVISLEDQNGNQLPIYHNGVLLEYISENYIDLSTVSTSTDEASTLSGTYYLKVKAINVLNRTTFPDSAFSSETISYTW